MGDTNEFEFKVATIITWLLPISMHSLGIYSLHLARNTDFDPTRRLYLLHLSISELLYCIGIFTHYIVDICGYKDLHFYVGAFSEAGIYMWFILIMISLTVDRFLMTYLNLRYNVLWSKSKTMVVLLTELFLSLIFMLIICFTQNKDYELMQTHLSLYFWAPADWLFVFIALFTYGYILKKFNVSRKTDVVVKATSDSHHVGTGEVNTLRRCERENKKMRNLFTLFVTTFVVFVVIPDQVYFFTSLLDIKISEPVDYLLEVFWAIGMTSDAFIYILILKKIRKLLWKKLSCFPFSKDFVRNTKEKDIKSMKRVPTIVISNDPKQTFNSNSSGNSTVVHKCH